MAQGAPSLVLSLVDALPTGVLTLGQGGLVAAIVRLAREISPELLPAKREDYVKFVQGVEGLQFAVMRWQIGGNTDAGEVRGAVNRLREALEACSDQVPLASTAALKFLRDKALAKSIRIDIGAAESDLRSGNWKGATVVAGSALEALLLWRIQRFKPAEIRIAVAALPPALAKKASKAPEWWHLAELIALAHHLRAISDEAEKAASLAQDFRNFIHPGKSLRLARACDYGTALAALAAVHILIREFS